MILSGSYDGCVGGKEDRLAHDLVVALIPTVRRHVDNVLVQIMIMMCVVIRLLIGRLMKRNGMKVWMVRISCSARHCHGRHRESYLDIVVYESRHSFSATFCVSPPDRGKR